MSASGAFFTAVSLTLPLSLPAAEAIKPAGAEGVPQNRCFCIQYTGGLPPYYLGRLSPSAPECAKMKYAASDKAPRENGLLTCDELRNCLRGSAQYAEKKKVLDAKTAQAKEQLAGCCASGGGKTAGAPCVNKCSSDWEGILKLLAAETEKLEKARQQALERCFSRPQKAAGKNKRAKSAGK